MKQQKLHHYVYKIVRDDGHYYIGIHSTDDLNDGYFGSGVHLRKSIRKHGLQAHTKIVLEQYLSRAEAEDQEALLVQYTLKDEKCLNHCLGGRRGPEQHLESTGEKISKALTGRKRSAEFKAKISVALMGVPKTLEHKQKCAVAQKARLATGVANPFAGEKGSAMATKRNLKNVQNGTNPWAGSLGSENSSKIARRQIEEGRHPFQQSRIIAAISARCKTQVKNGTHPFQNLQKLTCHCGKTGSAPNMRRWHFANCKSDC